MASGSGKDKITSWVDMVSEDPPPPPPVEGTIIDAPMHFAEDHAPDGHPLEETTAREMRENRQRRKNEAFAADDDIERRRRRRERKNEEEHKSSGGSSHARRSAYAAGPVNSLGYDDMHAPEERPAMAPKRQSWFSKVTGF